MQKYGKKRINKQIFKNFKNFLLSINRLRTVTLTPYFRRHKTQVRKGFLAALLTRLPDVQDDAGLALGQAYAERPAAHFDKLSDRISH